MNHVKDVKLEPNPKRVYGGPIPKMEGLDKCYDGRYSPSECHLTNTNLVLDSRQAPEHSKSPSVLQKLLVSFMIDALGYKG